MNRAAVGCLLLAILMFTGTASFAKLVFTPGLDLKEEYNDNIFLEKTDKEHDYITTITPNIKLEYAPDSRLDLTLNYGLDFRFYSRHSEFNDTGLRDSQNISFLAHAMPLKHFHIDVSDNYSRVPVDIRSRVAAGNVLVNMTESNTFSVSPYLMLPLTSTLSANVGYKYGNTWYRNEDNADFENHSAFFVLNKKLTSKLSAGVKYEFYSFITKQELVDVKDYDSNRGSVLVSYTMTPDFKIDGEAGRSWIDYKSEPNATVNFWNLNADYNFKITESTSLRAGYGASLQDSPTSGAFKQRRADIYFSAGKVLKFRLNPYYSVAKYIRADRQDKIKGVTVGITRPVTKKINLSLDGDWAEQNFTGEIEKDVRTYGAGGGFDYRITRKISAALNYRFNKMNSTLDEDDFTNNIVWLLAKVVF